MAKPVVSENATDPLDGVTLEQLRTFLAVAEAGSFSAAARALGRVQSAVSQAMERLETQLGLRLFDRSARVPRLTRGGLAVLSQARRVQSEFAALTEVARGLKAGVETQLTAVVDALFPSSALVSFAREFARAHPSVELTLLTETLSAVTAQVREQHAAFGVAGPAADFSGLERRHLTHVRLVPVAASSHALAAEPTPLTTATLAGSIQIVLSERASGAHRTEDQAVLATRTWRVVDLSTKHALIVAGLGWGNMPEHLVRDDLRRKRLTVLQPAAWSSDSYRLSLSLVKRPGSVPGPVTRWAQARLSSLCKAELSDGSAGSVGSAG